MPAWRNFGRARVAMTSDVPPESGSVPPPFAAGDRVVCVNNYAHSAQLNALELGHVYVVRTTSRFTDTIRVSTLDGRELTPNYRHTRFTRAT